STWLLPDAAPLRIWMRTATRLWCRANIVLRVATMAFATDRRAAALATATHPSAMVRAAGRADATDTATATAALPAAVAVMAAIARIAKWVPTHHSKTEPKIIPCY